MHIDAALGKILHTFCCGNGLKLLILWNYKPLNINTEINEKDLSKGDFVLASELKLVYSCLGLRPKMLDEFVKETGFPPEKVANVLLELELMGLIKETGRHYYIKQKNVR